MNPLLEYFPVPSRSKFYTGHAFSILNKLSGGFFQKDADDYEFAHKSLTAKQFLKFLEDRFNPTFEQSGDKGFEDIFVFSENPEPQITIDPLAAFKTARHNLSTSQCGFKAIHKLCAEITKELEGSVIEEDDGNHSYVIYKAIDTSLSAQIDAIQKATLIDVNFEDANVALQRLIVLRNGTIKPESLLGTKEQIKPIELQRHKFVDVLKKRLAEQQETGEEKANQR